MKTRKFNSFLAVALIGVAAVNAQTGITLVQDDYTFENIYSVEAISTLTDAGGNRSGIFYKDKVYVPTIFGDLTIYDKDGAVIKTIPPTEGYKMWTSCNLDAAGHLLVQIDNTSAAAFSGMISANGGHGFMVIDTDTDEVIVPFVPLTSSSVRYDAMAPVRQDIFTGEKVGIYTPVQNGVNFFRYLYNNPAANNGNPDRGSWPLYWQTVAKPVYGVVPDKPNEGDVSLFPAGAQAEASMGYIMEYVHADDAAFSIVNYCNPVYNITYSAEGMYGNGIRRYSAAYVPGQFYYTPQHAGVTGFNLFALDGKEYIIYPAGIRNEAADAFAIAEVSFVDSPATDMTMEGETLVDGRLAGTLKVRQYGATSDKGYYLYAANASCAPSYTVVPDENDPKSVYIYVYATGAPASKWKFTVGRPVETGVADIEASGTDAPVEYYNLQGIRVAEPADGVYIRRQGGNAKVCVK